MTDDWVPPARSPKDVPDEHPPPTLAEFLLARLAERERVARATEHSDGSRSLRWHAAGRRLVRFENGRSENYSAVLCGDWDRILVARDDVAGGPLAAHIALHDPARVLAEVAATRRIVELHTPTDRTGKHLCPVCVSWEIWLTQEPGEGLPLDDAPCTTLRLLALPYAAHESYRSEWAP